MEYINKAIGENIRKLRLNRQLTIDSLAEVAGISKSMLGQIERGEANPTIATIWKIANGLKVSFSTLISSAREPNEVIDISQVETLKSEDGLLINVPFFPFNAQRNFEMFEIILHPGGALEGSNHPPKTQEYLIVFEGVLIIEHNGETHIVRQNQAYNFYGDVSHRYSNIGSETTRFALVLFYESSVE